MQRQITPEEINSNKFESSGIVLKTQALCCGCFHLALNGTVWFLVPALLCSSLRFVFPYVDNGSFRIKKKNLSAFHLKNYIIQRTCHSNECGIRKITSADREKSLDQRGQETFLERRRIKLGCCEGGK